MKAGVVALLACALLCAALPAAAQIAREDVIWARKTTNAITLDGVLDEPDWDKAETKVIRYGHPNGIPGSGWKVEAGLFFGTDPLTATLKFLVKDNQLYLGAVVQDSSVGGSAEFNRFDGLLMAIKDHADTLAHPKPPAEYFYSWWAPDSLTPDPQPPGMVPNFFGRWGIFPPGPRDSASVANWDAVTTVQGLSNDDSVIDQGYTVEMRFNLAPMGYDVTQPGGDVVEWNIAIYDSDWFWPFDAAKFTTNRVWWQCPWGNAMWYNQVQVHARPDVTVGSGPVTPVPPTPTVGPDMIVSQIGGTPPTIDGDLSDGIWSDPDVISFDIRWGDDALRQTYPGVGPYRAGQYQPPVNGGEAFLVDPGDATVSLFHQDDVLYLGFDVRDFVVQYHPAFDRWDGFLVTISEYDSTGPDHQLATERLSFQVDSTGAGLPQDYLATLVSAGDASLGLQLGAGTTVDTLGANQDNGYTAELAIDLTGLGYPSGLGDGKLFLGINLLDGDSFLPVTDSYGNRTWWFREFEGECCPAWLHLEPFATSVEPALHPGSGDPVFVRAYPNPSPHPGIEYSLPVRTRALLEIFDVTGRRVESRELGTQDAGVYRVPFRTQGRAAGVYLYRMTITDPETGGRQTTGYGKMVLLK
jgi:hypothetical protein